MALEIQRDPRVRSVEWRDLTALSRAEVWCELLLPAPWLLASLVLAAQGVWPLALAASFLFFLCGLRQVHNAFHHAVGLPRRADDVLLAFLSLAMLGSMQAVRFNHLRHHRHCMDDEDVEAWSARLPGWKAVLLGPCFPFKLHAAALRQGSARVRRGVLLELSLNALPLAAALASDLCWLRYHVAAMALGQCLTAFFAVWTVHHDCDRSHYIARTVRGGARAFLTCNMFFHVEHHLFPAVPTCHLPELARRLDRAAPELASRRVF